jgi:competence protein ComEA
MLTRAEKIYLAMTLGFLAAGWGIKTWRRASVRIGPMADPATLALDSLRVADSLRGADSLRLADSPRDVGPTRSADASPSADSLPAAGSLVPPVEPASDPVKDRSTERPRASHAGRAPKAAATGPVNVNRAEAAELMHVKGIGEKTASAIVAYRRANGPFKDVRDLLRIKGIGEKKLEKLAPHLIL